MNFKVSAKLGLQAALAAATLENGELAYCTDTKRLYIYDGSNKVLINPYAQNIRKASRYHVFPSNIVGVGNYSISAGYLNAFPWPNEVDRTVTKMAITILTAAAAGKKARMGIYKDDGTVYPGAKVIDSGEFAIDAMGVVEVTGLSAVLEAGTLYWLCILTDANIVVAGFDPTYVVCGFIGSSSNNPTATRDSTFYVAQAYGALPATYPGSASTTHLVARIGLYF